MIVTVGTNSYITVAELQAYAADRGITLTGDVTILIARSMDYIESRKYIGYKTVSTQALQFPRVISTDYDSDTVPNEIKTAQCIAAIFIGQGEDLQPVVGQAIKRKKTDVLETEYQDNTTGTAQFTALSDVLRPFLNGGIRGVRV